MNSKLNCEKKRRIAHIGNLSNTCLQGESALNTEDFICNIIRDMDSTMKTSEKSIISFQEMEELRSRKKQAILRTDSTLQKSSDFNMSTSIYSSYRAKETKKILPPKVFPLMAKCQKNLKYLKHNRCIPKPRAHVGAVSKPPKKPFAKKIESPVKNAVSGRTSTKCRKQTFRKKDYKNHRITSSKSCQSEKNDSSDDMQNKNIAKDFLNSDTSDDEYEKFIRKHQKRKKTKHLSEHRDNSKRKKLKKSRSSGKSIGKQNIFPVHNIQFNRCPIESEHSSENDLELPGKDESTEKINDSISVTTEKSPKVDTKLNSDVDSMSEDGGNDFNTFDGIDSSDSEINDNANNDVISKKSFSKSVNALNQSQKTGEESILPSSSDATSACSSILSSVGVQLQSSLNKSYANETTNKEASSGSAVETHSLLSTETSSVISEPGSSSIPNNEQHSHLECGVPCSSRYPEEISPGSESDLEDCIITCEKITLKGIEPISSSKDKSSPKMNSDNSNKTQLSENASDKNENGNSPISISCPDSEGADCIIMEEISTNNYKNKNSELQGSNTELGRNFYSKENNSLKNDNLISREKSNFDHSQRTGSRTTEFAQIVSVCSVNKGTIEPKNTKINECDNDSDIEILDFADSGGSQKPSEIEDKIEGFPKSHLTINKDVNITIPSESQTGDTSDIDDCIIVSESIPSVSSSENNVKENKINVHNNEGNNHISNELQVNLLGEKELCNTKFSSQNSQKNVSGAENLNNNPKLKKSEKISMSKDSTEKHLNKNACPVISSEDCVIIDDDDCSKKTNLSTECDNTAQGNNKVVVENVGEMAITGFEANNSSSQVKIHENSSGINPICVPKILELLSTIDFDCIKKVLKDDSGVEEEKNKLAISDVPNADLDFQPQENKKALVQLGSEIVSSNNSSSNTLNNHPSAEPENVIKLKSEEPVQKITLPEIPNIAKSEKTAETLISLSPEEPENFSRNGSHVTCKMVQRQISEELKFQKSGIQNRFKFVKEINTGVKDTTEKLMVGSCNKTVSENGTKEKLMNIKTESSINTLNIVCFKKEIHFQPQVNFAKGSSSNKMNEKNCYKEDKMYLKAVEKKSNNFKLSDSLNEKLILPEIAKKEIIESQEDELDIIAANSIQALNESKITSVLPLMDLYKKEYNKYIEIKCTEKNVSAGLKLLEENQAKKLHHLGSSLKKLIKHDPCHYNTLKLSEQCSKSVEKEQTNTVVKASKINIVSKTEVFPGEYNKIFHPSVFENAQKYVKSTKPSRSSTEDKEVFELLMNSKCAQCGKRAVAACQGCAKIYYCSEECGINFWQNGHNTTCGT